MVSKNFQFKATWHKRTVVAMVLGWRLAQSNATVTPSVTCYGLII